MTEHTSLTTIPIEVRAQAEAEVEAMMETKERERRAARVLRAEQVRQTVDALQTISSAISGIEYSLGRIAEKLDRVFK